MLKIIVGTAGARIINAIMSFAIIIINARMLGAEGVGTIQLLVLGITIILLISNFAGGGALIYLVPRNDLFKLFIPSYIWAVLSSVAGAFILAFFGLIPVEFTVHVLFLSLLQGFTSVHYNILLGKEKIRQYNTISVLQVLLLMVSLAWLFFLLKRPDVFSFIFALYFSYLITFLLSLFSILKFIKFRQFQGFRQVIVQMFRYGAFVQVANLLQLLNYRLGYYIIERFLGKSSLGVFSTGTQISEGLWLVGKSVATVQYAKISNNDDAYFARKITLQFVKIVFVITMLMLFVLLAIPDSFFVMVFKKDFSGLNTVILSLAGGILFMAVSTIFSHYFSGTGRHHHNTIASGIGVLLTVIFGFALIPAYGITGAGFTATISYFSSLVYQVVVFKHLTKIALSDFLITRSDIIFMKGLVKELLNR